MRKLASFGWGCVLFLPAAALAQPAASRSQPSETPKVGGLVEASAAAERAAQDVDIDFDPGSAALTLEATGRLEELATWLGGDEARQVVIHQAAFASSEGQESEGVAQQRVEAIRSYLRGGGAVQGTRISVASGDGLAAMAAARSQNTRIVHIGTRGMGDKLPASKPGASLNAPPNDVQAATFAPMVAPAPSWLGGQSLVGAPTEPPPVATTLAFSEMELAQAPSPEAAPKALAAPKAAPPEPTALPATTALPASTAVPASTPPTEGNPSAVTPGAPPPAPPRAPRKKAMVTQRPATRNSDVGSRYDFGASTTDPSSQSVVWRQPSSPALTTRGLGVTVGGGVVGFLNSDTADLANTGGSWEARLIYGTRSFLAMEAAYIGSAQSLNVNGLPESALLVGHGAEGNLRVNFTRAMVQPYIFGGAGWTHYGLMRTEANTSALSGRDNVFHLPVGFGVGLRNDGMIFDLRATARVAFNETLMRNAFADRSGEGDLDSWNVSAKLGWEL